MLNWIRRAFGRGREASAVERAEPRLDVAGAAKPDAAVAATARATAVDIEPVEPAPRHVTPDELIARVAREAGVMRAEVWTARMLAIAVVRAIQERGDDALWTVGEVQDWIADVRLANGLPENIPTMKATLAALGVLVGKPHRERLSVEREEHRRLMARAKRRHGEVPERATIYRIGAGPISSRPPAPPAARATPAPAKKSVAAKSATVVPLDNARRKSGGSGGSGGKAQAKGRGGAQMALPLEDAAARPERRRRAA
jgi:hypothetical protein